MGLLNNTTVYLSGPIESATDAFSWRENIKPELTSLGIEIWDPLVKPGWMQRDADGSKQKEWKSCLIQYAEKDPIEIQSEAHEVELLAMGQHPELSNNIIHESNHQIRIVGKRLASACDFMICRITKEFTAGTFEELSLAAGKPVLFWADSKIPSMWLLDQFSDTKTWEHTFFDSWNKLLNYLMQVDRAEIEIDPIKWIFIDGIWNEKTRLQ